MFRRKKRASQLAALLSDYPPYVPPVVKALGALSEADAEANLADLLRVRPERLARFGGLLSEFGIDLDAGLAAVSPEPWLDELWRWTVEQWPSIYDAKLAAFNARRSPLGSHPVFGLLTDTGLALGETILRHRADYQWALDRDPDNREMASYRQPCVIRPADNRNHAIVFHAEDFADGAYAQCRGVPYQWMNELEYAVMDHISGAFESQPTPATHPPRRSASTVYDNADYHTGGARAAQAKAEWGASHLALFVAWAANHDLLSPEWRQQAAALRSRSMRPLEWLFTHRDGCLAEEDLTEAGNRFTRSYYGTPADGLHAGEGSYLRDFAATLQGGDDAITVEDSWENYDRIAAVIDARYVAFTHRT